MRVPWSIGAVAAIATAAGALAPSAAAARTVRPARGLYQCFQYTRTAGRLYAGGFRLVTWTRYRTAGRGMGAYRVRGRRVTFVSGPYRSFRGTSRRTRDHRWAVDIVLRSDRSVVEHCYRVRGS